MFKFVPEIQIKLQRTCFPDTDMLRAHLMGYLYWATNVTGEKCLSPLTHLGIEPGPLDS